MINRYSIYGDYVDDYCEDWQPTAGQPLFKCGAVGFAPARMPGYPTYVMRWLQAAEQSAGGDAVAYVPYVQELLLQLGWAGMSGTDKAGLESFFQVTASGMALPFTYFNPMTGPAFEVRFAEPTIPPMPEIAYDRYKVQLALRVDLNYPQMVTPGPAAGISGNRFVFGGVAMPFPDPVRSSTGYGITKPQTLERNSGGEAVIYTKSRLTLLRHTLAMVLDYDGFLGLLAYFFSFVHGRRHKFIWFDRDDVARNVRLADTQITVRQTAYNRYETEINLVEEL